MKKFQIPWNISNMASESVLENVQSLRLRNIVTIGFLVIEFFHACA